MLGLRAPTDPSWAPLAARSLGSVLVDHAHCEMKAASNAMSLVARYGGMPDVAPPAVVLALTELAQEELEHFRRVLTLLARRGEPLGSPPVDTYASLLRTRAAAKGWGAARPRERVMALVDRLIVGSLIEARSAERFKLLAEALEHGSEMHAFYTELFASEARHYRKFLDLAAAVAGDAGLVSARHGALAEVEAGVVGELARAGAEPSIHG